MLNIKHASGQIRLLTSVWKGQWSAWAETAEYQRRSTGVGIRTAITRREQIGCHYAFMVFTESGRRRDALLVEAQQVDGWCRAFIIVN